MKDTALVIMAAGTGSRFGGGTKQLEPVGPGSETIVDYSIHDVVEAGFNKAIFIIRRDLEKDFKEITGHRIEKLLPVKYVYQELRDLPAGYEVTPGRTKPQGTDQVVLFAKGTVDGPFLVINAGNYYGQGGFHRIHDYVTEHMDSQSEIHDVCMGEFVLSNTLSDDGTVTRGVYQTDGDGSLTSVIKTYNIQTKEDGLRATDENGTPVTISSSQPVFMNMWEPPVSFIQKLERGSPVFLDNLKEGDIKSEYLLPRIIDDLIQSKKAGVIVPDTSNKWFDATYREDKQTVTDAIRGLIESGVYEKKLFG